jgi:hypothetical protein
VSDFAVTAANVLPSAGANFARGTAGVALTAGQYIAIQAGLVQLYGATLSAPLNVLRGVTVDAAAAGQPVVYVASDPALTPGFTTIAGALVIGSANAGNAAPAADLVTGMVTTVAGIGLAGNQLNFNPYTAGVAHA